VDIFELGEFVDRPIRQLSLGQKVRCEVASCFLHGPEIVLLDEPTIGMDAIAKVQMRDYIRRINRECNVAVLLTSHDLFDVERVCERVMILDEGRLILQGTLESLRTAYCSERIVELTTAAPVETVRALDVPGAEMMPTGNQHKVKLRFDPRATSVFEIIETFGRAVEIVDFTVEEIPIDEFVARIYRRE
jgi:ABC-2 type transport system ATP-binding protein